MVVSSNSIVSNGSFTFDPPGTTGTVSLDGNTGLVYCNGYRTYKAGLKITSATNTLYRWFKKIS